MQMGSEGYSENRSFVLQEETGVCIMNVGFIRMSNQVRLQLFVLAYNLGNFLRQAVLPPAVRHWTLTTLREKLVKIGAKVVRHSRKIVFQMAEVAIPRELFQTILERNGRLRLATAMSG